MIALKKQNSLWMGKMDVYTLPGAHSQIMGSWLYSTCAFITKELGCGWSETKCENRSQSTPSILDNDDSADIDQVLWQLAGHYFHQGMGVDMLHTQKERSYSLCMQHIHMYTHEVPVTL